MLDEDILKGLLDEYILKGLLEDKLKELRRKFEEEGYTINKLNDDEKNTLRQRINEISSSVTLTHELSDHERYKIESLLIAGCNVEYKKADGDTPECIAKRINSEEILSLLKNAEKLVNAENRMGTTPLMVAALQGHTEKARWLIKKGAYINTKNKCHQISRGMELYGTVVSMSEEIIKPKLLTALMVARNIDTVKALIIAKRVGVYDAIITLLQENTVKKVVPSILSTLFRIFIR
jgi:ankyrin repeat protein